LAGIKGERKNINKDIFYIKYNKWGGINIERD